MKGWFWRNLGLLFYITFLLGLYFGIMLGLGARDSILVIFTWVNALAFYFICGCILKQKNRSLWWLLFWPLIFLLEDREKKSK
jgi:hypothetical protein